MSPAPPFGCVYVQGMSVGVASYHFDSPGNIYISYEHAPPQWRLDNGDSPPMRKPFLEPAYNTDTRTFTGIIDWAESPFAGAFGSVY